MFVNSAESEEDKKLFKATANLIMQNMFDLYHKQSHQNTDTRHDKIFAHLNELTKFQQFQQLQNENNTNLEANSNPSRTSS